MAYDGLVDYGAKEHYRAKHSKNEFANGKNHINGIENFLAAISSCYLQDPLSSLVEYDRKFLYLYCYYT